MVEWRGLGRQRTVAITAGPEALDGHFPTPHRTTAKPTMPGKRFTTGVPIVTESLYSWYFFWDRVRESARAVRKRASDQVGWYGM
jgi:hypothetical protein